MRRRVNGEAISETDWGLFLKLEGGKNKVGSEAEVGNEYKGRERSKWKGPFAGHFSGLKRAFTDSDWMLSLFLFCVLWKR